MGRWSRQELEEAFQLYQETALRAGTSGDWRPWADLFTEDATWVEHHYGTMGGREAIYNTIQKTMSEPINRDMRYFPIEWYLIDEERGWVVCQVWNRMIDPGDGSLHQESNITVLRYAGGMKWSYEEDAYNPVNFAKMVKGWIDRKAELESAKG
jgi:uncharacterized protein (TIGR02246 family)